MPSVFTASSAGGGTSAKSGTSWSDHEGQITSSTPSPATASSSVAGIETATTPTYETNSPVSPSLITSSGSWESDVVNSTLTHGTVLSPVTATQTDVPLTFLTTEASSDGSTTASSTSDSSKTSITSSPPQSPAVVSALQITTPDSTPSTLSPSPTPSSTGSTLESPWRQSVPSRFESIPAETILFRSSKAWNTYLDATAVFGTDYSSMTNNQMKYLTESKVSLLNTEHEMKSLYASAGGVHSQVEKVQKLWDRWGTPDNEEWEGDENAEGVTNGDSQLVPVLRPALRDLNRSLDAELSRFQFARWDT